MELDQIRTLHKYNKWANERFFDAVSNLTPEQYTRDMQSSHRSVRDTFVHVISVEWIYQQRVNGDSPKSLWSSLDFLTVPKLKEEWVKLIGRQMSFVANLTEKQLKTPITYINLAGEPRTYFLWQILQHVVNHSSYHRGQITTMLRQLGAVPVSTDFLLYYDVVNG